MGAEIIALRPRQTAATSSVQSLDDAVRSLNSAWGRFLTERPHPDDVADYRRSIDSALRQLAALQGFDAK